MIDARTNAKKNNNQLLQLIYKDMVNGLYGKTSQGIRNRKTFVIGEGESKPLPPSIITNPYMASITTGTVRAAMSSIIDCMSKMEDYEIISATTDGVLYKTKGSKSYKLKTDLLFNKKIINKKYDGSIESALKSGNDDYINSFESIDKELYDELLTYPSIRLLKLSREILGYKVFIEVKNVATRVMSIKTRLQIGYYKYKDTEYLTILAKGGNKIDKEKEEQAQQLIEWNNTKELTKNRVTTLASLQSITDKDNSINDLVSITKEVKVNVDYDLKRKMISNNKTEPFIDINEAKKYRGCAKYIRSNGKRATQEEVEYAFKLAKNNVVKRGSNRDLTVRYFLRALVKGIYPFPSVLENTYVDIAKKLSDYGVTVSKVRDAKRSNFVSNIIRNTSSNRQLIKLMLNEFNFNVSYKEILDLLINKGISNGNEIV